MKRMTGRRLQDRRLRMWSADPFCKGCGRLTAWPNGFELDHKIALDNGGEDTEENCQILCVLTCHNKKTAKDMGYAERTEFDERGRVRW